MVCGVQQLQCDTLCLAFVAAEDKELFVMITGVIMMLEQCVKCWGNKSLLGLEKKMTTTLGKEQEKSR